MITFRCFLIKFDQLIVDSNKKYFTNNILQTIQELLIFNLYSHMSHLSPVVVTIAFEPNGIREHHLLYSKAVVGTNIL